MPLNNNTSRGAELRRSWLDFPKVCLRWAKTFCWTMRCRYLPPGNRRKFEHNKPTARRAVWALGCRECHCRGEMLYNVEPLISSQSLIYIPRTCPLSKYWNFTRWERVDFLFIAYEIINRSKSKVLIVKRLSPI